MDSLHTGMPRDVSEPTLLATRERLERIVTPDRRRFELSLRSPTAGSSGYVSAES